MRVRSDCQRCLHSLLLVTAIFVLGESDLPGQEGADKPATPSLQQDNVGTSGEKLTQQQADAIQIQMDAKGPIFVLASAGGGVVAPAAGQNRNPKLQVFADRKIIVGGSAGVPRIESKLTESEMIEFLDFVVNKNKFYEIKTEDLYQRMMGKEKTTLRDANSAVLTIELQQGKHEVEVYALWNAIKNFPDMAEIQHLAAIEKRCNAIISKVQLGDDGDKVLKLVNEKVAELGLGLAPFTLEEMRLASRLANGRFQVSFQRELPAADGKTGSESKLMHAIYFVKNTMAEPKVSFFNLPKKN